MNSEALAIKKSIVQKKIDQSDGATTKVSFLLIITPLASLVPDALYCLAIYNKYGC